MVSAPLGAAATSRPAARPGGGGAGSRDAAAIFAAGSSPQPKLGTPSFPSLTTRRRIAALVFLLEQFHELRDSLRSGDGDNERSSGLLLAPHESHCHIYKRIATCTCILSDVAEVERLLAAMKTTVPDLRWHVVAYFVDAEEKGRWEKRPVKKGRRYFSPLVYRRFTTRNEKAQKALALAGVKWMAENWNLRDLRGELVEPLALLDSGGRGAVASRHSSPRALFLRSAMA
jgi:hypothetical protein